MMISQQSQQPFWKAAAVITLGSIDTACKTETRSKRHYRSVNDKVIKSAGVAGVMKPGKTSVQVIIGPKVQFVADAFSKLCE